MSDRAITLSFLVGTLVLFGTVFLIGFSGIEWLHLKMSPHAAVEDWQDRPDRNFKCLKPPCYPHTAPKPWDHD